MCWIPVGARNSADENHYVLDAFDCEVLFFQKYFAPVIAELRPRLPKIRLWICIDDELPEFPGARSLAELGRGPAGDAAERRGRHGRRRDAVGDRRHHRHAEGRDEHPSQRADVLRPLHDRLPVRRGGAAGQPRGGADDAYRRPAVRALHGARRHGRRGDQARPGAAAGGDPEVPGHRAVPAADGDLPAARHPGPRQEGGFLVAQVLHVRRGADVGARSSSRRSR